MIKLSYMRLLALICLVLSIGALSSCKKDNDDVNDGKVHLLSFGPTGARHGDTLRFIGQNLNKVTSIQFTGTNAVVEQKDFKQQTPELILLVVPATAEKGYVTLKSSDGDIVTKTILNLNVKTSGSITSMVKQAKHGENITISGSYMNWVTRVTFPKNRMVSTFVSKSFDQLIVQVPADAESGPLVLTFAGTDSIDIQTKDTLRLTMPQITGMNPNPVDTSANLTITGTNLDLVSSVSFANVTNPVTNFVSQTATQLVVKVPSTALRGKLTFGIKNSTLTVQSPVDLTLNTLPPLADFAVPIYTDALQNSFQDWSYTNTHDFTNTGRVRQGTRAIKAEYAGNGYQGITFHHGGSGVSTTGYTKLEFSVYADAAANGQKLQIITNGAYGGPTPQVTLIGGAWTTFSVPLSTMGSPATITEIVLQGANFQGTVYIDHVGLRQ
ncbi:MAG: hypothetical protein EOO10_16880 [Chitinophagaceae bacterium]|nr:MAG: hypothetical protein EOO10_16880 [Chitinophagaceae bacterium]